MTPEEIQRTMDFILRSQADSVIRMDRLDEKQRELEQNIEKTQQEIDTLVGITRDHLRWTSQLLESTTARLDRDEDIIALLTRIAESNSNRLDRLET